MKKPSSPPTAKSAAASASLPRRGSEEKAAAQERLAKAKAILAVMLADRHRDDCRWEGEGKEPLFYAITIPDGRTVWRMSGKLYQKKADLLRFAKNEDKELQAAAVALTIASARCLLGNADDLEDHPIKWTEGQPAFAGFLLPLAKRLQGLNRANQEESEKIKKEALKWVGLVIENSFPHVLQSRHVQRESAQLIDIAGLLCNRHNRLPTKQEVKIASPWWGSTEDNTWWKRFRDAGLSDLPPAR